MRRLILAALVLGLILPSLTGCGRCKCVKGAVASTETYSGTPAQTIGSTGGTFPSASRAIK